MARVIYNPKVEPLSYVQALRFGFPVSPSPGQIVKDRYGRWWIWHGGGDLGSFGFWGVFTKILGAVAPIFSGGGDKKAQQAQAKSSAEMNQHLAAIEAKLSEPTGFDALFTKRNMLIGIAALMAFSLFKGK